MKAKNHNALKPEPFVGVVVVMKPEPDPPRTTPPLFCFFFTSVLSSFALPSSPPSRHRLQEHEVSAEAPLLMWRLAFEPWLNEPSALV